MPVKFQFDSKSRKVTVVEFGNGVPVNGTSFSCEVYQEKRQSAQYRERKVMLVKGKHVDYFGNNFDHRSSHPYACKYALAKVNRKTKCAKVYDIDYFKLKPVLQQQSVNEIPEPATSKTNRERDMELTKVFGTKLKQRQMLRNNIETLDSTVIKDVEALKSKPGYVSLDDEVDSIFTLLPYNKSATSVDEVYSLNDIVPENVFSSISGMARRFTRLTNEDIEMFHLQKGAIGSKLVLQLLDKKVGLGDDNASKLAAILLFFIHLADILYFSKERHTSPKVNISNSTVKAWINSEFFEGVDGIFRLPTKNKDKLLATVIVLAWCLTSFSFQTELVRSIVNIPVKRFTQVVSSLGGRIRNADAVLPFPPLDIGHGFKLRSRTTKEYA